MTGASRDAPPARLAGLRALTAAWSSADAVQRACALGAVLWLAAHAPLPALLALDVTRAPALSLVAVAVVLAVCVPLLRPLRGSDLAMPSWAAWLTAAVMPAAGLAVMPFLPEEAWRTYGNWWPGATQVLAAALVMRRRRGAALAGELGSLAVIAGCVLAADADRAAVTIAALDQPALLWLSASLGVRALYDRTAREVSRYAADTRTAVAEAAAARARLQGARARREDLDLRTVPLLQRIAGAGPADPGWPELAREAAGAERQLRDDLHARALLDPAVRRALRAARARGCTVDVFDDRRRSDGEDAGFLAGVRTALAAVLPVCGRAHVTFRLPPAGRHATVSVDGTPAEADAAGRALERARPAGLVADLDVVEGSLWAELRPSGPDAGGAPA